MSENRELNDIEHVREQIREKLPKKVHFPISWQIMIIVDIFLWLAIVLRIGATVTQQEFLNWIGAVSFWVLIVVTALLTLELLFLTIFYNQLIKAPYVLFTVFVISVTVDVFIVILVLYGMGFITGVPTTGVA